VCHLILLLPIFGLGVFWLWPLSVAVPIYLAILLVSGALYYVAMRAMQRAVQTGAEGMAHKTGEIVEAHRRRGRLKVEGEIWNAVSTGTLRPGQEVEILGVTDRLTLRVREPRRPPRG
jgi:membrane protein implicated in regulation of membrane protease activity